MTEKIAHKYTIYNGDSDQLIDKLLLEGVQVDHIITDPP